MSGTGMSASPLLIDRRKVPQSGALLHLCPGRVCAFLKLSPPIEMVLRKTLLVLFAHTDLDYFVPLPSTLEKIASLLGTFSGDICTAMAGSGLWQRAGSSPPVLPPSLVLRPGVPFGPFLPPTSQGQSLTRTPHWALSSPLPSTLLFCLDVGSSPKSPPSLSLPAPLCAEHQRETNLHRQF